MKKGFTLLELIVVIIILGILATVGYTQYTNTVEKGRLAEAIARIGFMRKLAYEYYVKNGSLTGIQDSDVEAGGGCDSSHFYFYYQLAAPTFLDLCARRCTTDGKTPNAPREYLYSMRFFPSTSYASWGCRYTDDNSSCFGLPPWPP